MELFRSITLVLAVVGKEVVETLRRPAAVASLVLGPLLLMLLFGLGYDGVRRPLEALIVVPPGSGLPTDPTAYSGGDVAGLQIAGVTPDEASARQRLQAGTVDMVVVAPADAQARLQAGQQAQIRVLYTAVDPIRASEAELLARQISAEANKRLIEQLVRKGEASAPAPAPSIRPEVVAAPTTIATENLSPTQPGVIAFFGPAALALVVQHVCVTLLALSLVRERSAGRFEVFRVAPVSAAELVIGKALAYTAAGVLVAAIIVLVLVQVLRVPVLVDPSWVALTLGLVLAASLGLGALVGAISDTERQVVQLSLLVLLGSVFFGGFVLSIDEFRPFAQVVAYLLPVTHGIALLHDQMLLGEPGPAWQMGALAAMAIGETFVAWRLLRRAIATA